MKKHFIFLPLLALAAPAAAQQTEIIGRAGLGLMQFGGPDAVGTSQVNYGYGGGYTNTPYGSRLGTGFTLGVRAQRVGKRQGLLAFDLGYDWLRSRMTIDYLNSSELLNGQYPADGTTHLQTQNFTAFVGLGHRFRLAAVGLDALVGPEMAYVFGFHEKGSGSYDGIYAWTTDRSNRAANRADARLRADVTAWYQRVGFNVSYSHGFLNYQSGLLGGDHQVYSRTLRLGVAYRLY